VDEMNRILREKFVELYETPILKNVSISTAILLYKLER
jgi:DNA-directed RNA polymerase